jgi:hypothetical protein
MTHATEDLNLRELRKEQQRRADNRGLIERMRLNAPKPAQDPVLLRWAE